MGPGDPECIRVVPHATYPHGLPIGCWRMGMGHVTVYTPPRRAAGTPSGTKVPSIIVECSITTRHPLLGEKLTKYSLEPDAESRVSSQTFAMRGGLIQGL